MLGVGIIIPIIPVLFFGEDVSSPLVQNLSHNQRSIIYGWLIGVYPFMQFIGAPALGALSDRHGRKIILIISLTLTMVGYLLFARAILSGEIWLLFASRMLSGLGGGNLAVILSAIADVSEPETKARNFGLVGLALGLGFVLGPTIGGLLADDQLVSWFNPSTPFYFTALITLINIVLLQWLFRETLLEKRKSAITFTKGFEDIAASFKMQNLRHIFSVVVLIWLGFTFFTQFFSVRLIEKYNFTETDIGILYGFIGLCLALTQGVLVDRLSRYFSSARVLLYSILGLAISIALVLTTDTVWTFYVIGGFIALSQGVTAPNVNVVVSEQAEPNQQGETMGIKQSMQSFGQTLPPIIAGYINTISVDLPIWAAFIFIFIGWIVYRWGFWPNRRRSEREKDSAKREMASKGLPE